MNHLQKNKNQIFNSFIKVFVVFLFAFMLIYFLVPDEKAYTSTSNNWMSNIDSNVKVSQLTIPGTHDSSTFCLYGAMSDFAQCQDMSFEEQLDAGLRAFDLRYGYDGGKFCLYHGATWPFIYKCYEKYKEHWYDLRNKELQLCNVLEKFNNYLKTHPEEFIVINLQRENGDSGDVVNKALDKIYKQYNIYTTLSNETTIEDVRGKIVLGSTFMQAPGGDSPYNRWSGSVDQKLADLDYVFKNAPYTNKTDTSKIEQKIIYTNLSWSIQHLLKDPRYYAQTIHNKFFSDSINPFVKYQHQTARNKFKAFGVILYDFPSKSLINNTIQANNWAMK